MATVSTSPVREHRLGVGLTVLSAVTFGATGVLAKVAYQSGIGVPSLLASRFTLAALVLWALVAWRRPGLPPLRIALAALALGAVGYAGESLLYFSALSRLDASLVSLLLATYPAIVVVAAIALGRERPDRQRTLALLAALGGTALVLGGASVGALSGLGLLLAAGSAVSYATYVLIADSFTRHVDGLLLAALVISGAALGTLTVAGGSGRLALPADVTSLWTVTALALLCTVVPITSFLLALPRIGPGTAAILSTLETVIGVGLAAVLLGDALGPLQTLGAALVLGAVVALQAGGSGATSVAGDEPAAAPAASTPARSLAHQPA